MKIQVLAWERLENVAVLNRIMGSQPLMIFGSHMQHLFTKLKILAQIHILVSFCIFILYRNDLRMIFKTIFWVIKIWHPILAPLKMEFLIGRYIMEEKSIMIG
jgi:hypothetical protein